MNNSRVKCRECGIWFPRLEWMKNKECDNPNCRCPEVQKLRKAANDVIEKAQTQAGINVINTSRATIPTGYVKEEQQNMIDVPDVMVVDIIVPKTHFGRRRGR